MGWGLRKSRVALVHLTDSGTPMGQAWECAVVLVETCGPGAIAVTWRYGDS